MRKVLVSTVWEAHEHIVRCIHNLGVNEVIVLVDMDKKEKQLEAIKKLKETYSDVLEITTENIEIYDIPKISKKCVKIIDKISKDHKIYINLTGGRKTQCLGLLFAAFRRFDKITGLYYVTEEEKKFIELPKLRFDVNESQKQLLKILFYPKNGSENLIALARKTRKSRPLLYKNLKDLEEQGLIDKDGKYYLTTAGKIAIL